MLTSNRGREVSSSDPAETLIRWIAEVMCVDGAGSTYLREVRSSESDGVVY